MEDDRHAIARNVEFVIEQLGPLSDVDFGLNRESVAWVEGFIERTRTQPDLSLDTVEGLVGTLGSILGECIAVKREAAGT